MFDTNKVCSMLLFAYIFILLSSFGGSFLISIFDVHLNSKLDVAKINSMLHE